MAAWQHRRGDEWTAANCSREAQGILAVDSWRLRLPERHPCHSYHRGILRLAFLSGGATDRSDRGAGGSSNAHAGVEQPGQATEHVAFLNGAARNGFTASRHSAKPRNATATDFSRATGAGHRRSDAVRFSAHAAGHYHHSAAGVAGRCEQGWQFTDELCAHRRRQRHHHLDPASAEPSRRGEDPPPDGGR